MKGYAKLEDFPNIEEAVNSFSGNALNVSILRQKYLPVTYKYI